MTTYTHRYLARIIVEAETPLAVGSGERDVLTNQLVATDCNGLPYIPGTALAGVLRHSLAGHLNDTDLNPLFGFQLDKEEEEKIRKTENREPTEKEKGQGSRLILSHAQMIGHEGKPVDGLAEIVWDSDFYKPFQTLPIRQHVRISHRGAGASEEKGKFDEQVVYKGTRFCFEMELVSDGNSNDADVWKKMLELFRSPVFRIGGGTRKGFGEISIHEYREIKIDMTKNLQAYLNKTSSLNDNLWENISPVNPKSNESNWIKYELRLEPEDFFLFSSGLENDNAKMIPVTEKVISWKNPLKPTFTKEQILIPATSVKGALAHRVAFYYNKKEEIFGDKLTEELLEKKGYDMSIEVKGDQNRLFEIATKGNPAVRALFGYSAKGDDGQRGKVIFSDLIEGGLTPESKKLLNHVAIDRFTGGAMDSALYNEEVVYGKGTPYNLTIQVDAEGLNNDYIEAFELALNDLKTGMLPMGGGTMRGHGRFTGTITKNGKEL